MAKKAKIKKAVNVMPTLSENKFYEDSHAFISYCFERTQIDTDYRIVLSHFRCDCLKCSELEKKHFDFFQIYLVADNHNFDQPIINTCELRNIFNDKVIEFDHILKIIEALCDKKKYKLENYESPGRGLSKSIFAGTDILIAKGYLSDILLLLYRYGTEKTFKSINDPLTFFD